MIDKLNLRCLIFCGIFLFPCVTYAQQADCPPLLKNKTAPASACDSTPDSAYSDSNRDAEDADTSLLLVLLQKRGCDQWTPGFKEKAAAAWEKFQSHRAMQIKRIEASDAFKRLASEIRDDPPSGIQPAELAQQCSDDFIDEFSQADEPPNSQFSSAESTWSVWRNALIAGDKDTALSCLTGKAKEIFRPFLKKVPNERLKTMAESYGTLKASSSFEPFQIFYTEIHGTLHEVTFENVRGEWLITQM